MSGRTTTDAVLATLLLAFAIGLVVYRGTSITLVPVVLGAVSTIGVEYLLSQRHDAVRTIWRRSVVRTAAVGGAILILFGAAMVRAGDALVFLLAAFATYLLLLGAVRTGVLQPPREW